jgi:hypothetical protein
VSVQAKWSAADAKELAKQARATARHSLADATSTEEPGNMPLETDESAVRGKPSLWRSYEVQAMEKLAHVRATVAQADKALSRRLTNEAFGSQTIAYRAFRREVLNCVFATSDDGVAAR